MNVRLFIVIGSGLVLGILSALIILPSGSDTLPPGPRQVTTGKALIGGAFTATDHRGASVTDKTFHGRYMLVYFGFTHCPDVCPAGLQVISGALDKLGKKADRLTPLFITLDPERDTPAVLAEYVKSFHPRIVGLTGTVDEIEVVAKKAFRVYYAKVANKDLPGDYTVDHSSFIYLMDAKGDYVRHFPHSTGVDKLAAGLAAHL